MSNTNEAIRLLESLGGEVSPEIRQKLCNDLIEATDKDDVTDLNALQETLFQYGDRYFAEFEALALEYLGRPGKEIFLELVKLARVPGSDHEIVKTVQLLQENPRTDHIALALFCQILYEYSPSALVIFLQGYEQHIKRIESRN